MTLDGETGDLRIEGGRIALGRPATTTAYVVTVANRGELKELPLIGGEAVRQLGGQRAGLWLTRVRKMLTAVGLRVVRLEFDGSSTGVQMEVE